MNTERGLPRSERRESSTTLAQTLLESPLEQLEGLCMTRGLDLPCLAKSTVSCLGGHNLYAAKTAHQKGRRGIE